MFESLLQNGDTADKGKLLSLTVSSVYNSDYCKYKTKYTENTAEYPTYKRNKGDSAGNCFENEEHKSLICVVACKS